MAEDLGLPRKAKQRQQSAIGDAGGAHPAGGKGGASSSAGATSGVPPARAPLSSGQAACGVPSAQASAGGAATTGGVPSDQAAGTRGVPSARATRSAGTLQEQPAAETAGPLTERLGSNISLAIGEGATRGFPHVDGLLLTQKPPRAVNIHRSSVENS